MSLGSDQYLNDVCAFFRENQDWYLTRFGYAACELWLCAEICNILNFDHPSAFAKQGSKKFCFNEDKRRDLTIYDDAIQSGHISSHIEVKLLYPSYSAKKKKTKLHELIKKQANSEWIFMIWTSTWSGSFKNKHDFFTAALADIADYAHEYPVGNTLSQSAAIDVIDGTFDWRDVRKEIAVKAISLNRQ